jgi:hypothetical protein
VLVSIEHDHRLFADRRSIVDSLSAEDDADLEPQRAELSMKTPDLRGRRPTCELPAGHNVVTELRKSA